MRRAFYFAPMVAALLLSGARQPSRDRAHAAPDLGPMRVIEFDVDEFTWLNLDVSPDGRTILFDVLGDLYTVPITGGEAALLMGGRAWEHMARWSPDGRSIAFVSDRDGALNVWVARADGSQPRQLSRERRGGMAVPVWTPDGAHIVGTRAGTPSGWLRRWSVADGAESTLVAGPARYGAPAFTPDGRTAYVAVSRGGWQLERHDLATGNSLPATARGGYRPLVSLDGRWLAYARRVHSARRTPEERTRGVTTELRLRELATGDERTLTTLATNDDSQGRGAQDALPGYAFTPDARAIVVANNGRVQRVSVPGGEVQPIPVRVRVRQEVPWPVRASLRIDDGPLRARDIRWPNVSRDGRTLVFEALGQVWVQPLPANGRPPRALAAPASGERQYAPALSPDGRWVAYVTWADTAAGHVMVRGVDGGAARRITTVAGRHANPAWSPDGRMLAFVRGAGVEQRQETLFTESYLELLVADVRGGEPRVIATTTVGSGELRRHPTLAFSPDGARLWFTEHHNDGYPSEAGARPANELRSVRLDGSDPRLHLRVRFGEQITPAADGRSALVQRREEIYLVPLPPPESAATRLDLDHDGGALPPGVRRLTNGGGTFPAWQAPGVATWTFGGSVWRSGGGGTWRVADVVLRAPKHRATGVIAFRDARLVTMRGDTVIERGTIVVRAGRIVAIGAAEVALPRDAMVVDAAGTTVVPGLIDAHAHLHGDRAGHEVLPTQSWQYAASLAFGVTSILDPSAHNVDAFTHAELVETGRSIGPRVFATGEPIVGGTTANTSHVPIGGLEDARTVARRQRGLGAAMLKEYSQPRRDQRQWLAQAAREEGLGITSDHGYDLPLQLTTVADGYTAFEHGIGITPLYRDVIELLARSGTDYAQTLLVAGDVAEAGYSTYVATERPHLDAKLRRFVPEAALDVIYRSPVAIEDAHFLRVAAGAARVVKAGGRVSFGAHGNLPGLGTQWELWALQHGGLTPMEALRSATVVAAQKIGVERDVGALAPGMLADFLVLDANPLDDIRNTARIRWVVQGGVVYDAASMAELWPERRQLSRFYWQTDDDLARFGAPVPAPLATRPARTPATHPSGR